MRAYERFLKYIQFVTASDELNPACPSTEGQRVFALALADELRALGASDARVDEHGYLYASVPANVMGAPSIGLIAHLDTVSDVPCAPMNARLVSDYDGGDILLENGETLSVRMFPRLSSYRGQTMIVTDGRTLLGADDKAGVAEIVTAVEALFADPSIPHGRVCIAFTPDEEIGRGADLFDVAGFGADFAYTVDGGENGCVNWENFNAASGRVTVRGVNIHPGAAKDKMINAALVAARFVALLPAAETPAHTEGREGFYHLTSIRGEAESAVVEYIIRDHDRQRFEARKAHFLRAAELLNGEFGEGVVSAEVKDSYYNMREALAGREDIVERAENAMRLVGLAPYREPVRGGTDGSRLSYMGLLCPNLSTGGMNCHGRRECISVQSMDEMTRVLIEIVREAKKE